VTGVPAVIDQLQPCILISCDIAVDNVLDVRSAEAML
jgi:hypothetical protein